VRRQDFLDVGGFDTAYWPGEDTKLCRDLLLRTKKRMVYVPEALVFHHRRSGLKRHLKQIGNYGMHRGFFAKKFPETSFRLIYMVPSALFVWVVMGGAVSVSLVHDVPTLLNVYLLGLLAYGAALAYSTFSIFAKVKSVSISIATIPYIAGTHLWYGLRFIYGFFFVWSLESKLGR
jgi:hypothetical protein